MDVIGGKVTIAERENEFVYHERVPEGVVGDALRGVSLVKPIPFRMEDPAILGSPLFARLVPMAAHEASSLYSEEKAQLLRAYSSKIEEKNETLERTLLALQLDQLELGGPTRIPQELVDACAALSVNGEAVKRLREAMGKLSGLYCDVEGNIGEVRDILEELKEAEGPAGDELRKEAEKLEGAHKVAAETNETLTDTVRRHVGNLEILMKPLDAVLQQHLPSVDPSKVDEDAEAQMKRLAG
jgi:tyrosine-protein phosphatase non-receptor type 23